jgi:glutaconate CoA-transferase subunit B
MSTDYSRQEMMAIATGREIRDGELAIFGVGLSMLAGYFAQAHHAPRVRAMTEGGVYGATPVGGLPWGIECNRLAVNAVSFTSALDALGCLVASGRCDVGIIGAAQVDRFGNVNTTGIWDGPIGASYRPPKTRLTGAGGANDIACGAKRYLIMVSHEPKALRGPRELHHLTGLPRRRRCPGTGGFRRWRSLGDHHHPRHPAARPTDA